MTPPKCSNEVQTAFDEMPALSRAGCLELRDLIFDVAATTPEAGRISEELRWGQPAYLTPDTKSGSTIRLGVPKAAGFALFVHCQTSLIEEFRPIAPKEMRFDGKRAVLFDDPSEVNADALSLLIRAALTYHL